MPTGRTQRTARKLDRAKALAQAQRGLSNPEIAKQQGVNTSTVFRFMQRMKPERQALRGGPSCLDSMFHSLSGASRWSDYAAVSRVVRLSQYTCSGVLPSSARCGLVWL